MQVHSNAYGIIESNGYPTQNYPNGDSCKYIIEAKHGDKILLEFDEFDLEQSSNCVNDYLQFSEQSIDTSVKRCGNDKRPYFSRTKEVVLMFYSNSNVNGKGFRIRYKSTLFLLIDNSVLKRSTSRSYLSSFHLWFPHAQSTHLIYIAKAKQKQQQLR